MSYGISINDLYLHSAVWFFRGFCTFRLFLIYILIFAFDQQKMGVAWWNLQSQLLVAIQKDDVMRAKELLADGVDCDARFNFGSHRRPALCLCVERDSLDLGMHYYSIIYTK